LNALGCEVCGCSSVAAGVGVLHLHLATIVERASTASMVASIRPRSRPRLHPALVNGATGAVVTIYGQPFAVMGFPVVEGRIVTIAAIADPARVRRIARRCSGRGVVPRPVRSRRICATDQENRRTPQTTNHAMMETISRACATRCGSPSVRSDGRASSGEIPLVQRRQAVSWSIVTVALSILPSSWASVQRS